MHKLSVIGLGKLGAPMLATFAHKGYTVVGMDLNPDFVASINAGEALVPEPQLQEFLSANMDRISATTDMSEAVLNSDISFIIVPTPSGENRFFKNDYVISALKSIGEALREKTGYHNVVVTSTVMPGSTGSVLKDALEAASGRKVGPELGLCYNPEFIALGTVVRDMLYPDMILIGESDKKAGDMLEQVYSGSVNSSPEFQRMNWVNAELCKIAVNTYVTTKISYANMIADMCDHLEGADSDVVTAALGADSRIGKKYIKGAIAYGGPCFPRDNKAFAALGRKLGAKTDLAEATDAINDYQTDRLLNAVRSVYKENSTIAVLGLSYKPNTPVIEESQGLALSKRLLAEGYNVRITDPEAMPNVKNLDKTSGILCDSVQSALEGADIIIIMTPWSEYSKISISGPNPKFVIDPWRLINESNLPASAKLIRPGVGDWMQGADQQRTKQVKAS